MKKSIVGGAVAIVLSFVLMIAFIVGGVTKIQSGPAKVLENLEKAINKGDGEKALECYGLQNSLLFTAHDIPYYGMKDVNFIPGEVEEVEGDSSRVILHYAVVYEANGQVFYETEKDTFAKSDGKWIIQIL